MLYQMTIYSNFMLQILLKSTKIFYLILSMFLLGSCNKKDDAIDDYVRYQINGKAYEVLGNFKISGSKNNIRTSKINNILLIDCDNKEFQSISLFFDYNLNQIVEKKFTELNGGRGVYTSRNNNQDYFKSITFNSYILLNKDNYYYGTFEFIGIGDRSGDTVKITDGSFKIGLIE